VSLTSIFNHAASMRDGCTMCPTFSRPRPTSGAFTSGLMLICHPSRGVPVPQ